MIIGVLHFIFPISLLLYYFIVPIHYDPYMCIFLIFVFIIWIFLKLYFIRENTEITDMKQVLNYIHDKVKIPKSILYIMSHTLNYIVLIVLFIRMMLFDSIESSINKYIHQIYIFLYYIFTIVICVYYICILTYLTFLKIYM